MIQLYLAWLDLLGAEPERLSCRVMIHATADVTGAEHYWADLVGTDASQLRKTTVKKHNPKTVRKNVGENYRGCLVIRMSRCAELYQRIEGCWAGMTAAAKDRITAQRAGDNQSPPMPSPRGSTVRHSRGRDLDGPSQMSALVH